jgi:hypothetical protein
MGYPIATATRDVRAVLEPVIAAVWISLGYTADTIEWPNIYFQKPGNGPWIRVSYPQQSTEPFTWCAGVVQNITIALLSIQIFVPKNAGDVVLIAATDAFRATFERQVFGQGIRFREAQGPNDTAFETQWAGRNLTLPHEYIEDINL